MSKSSDLITSGLLLFIAFVMPKFFQAPAVAGWIVGSAVFFILPGYWLLKIFTGLKIENIIMHLTLSFPLSLGYLSLASFLVNQAGVDITYFSLLGLSSLPCLVWLSKMAWKGR